MTEDTGFAEPAPEDEPAAAEPADVPAADEPQAEPEPAEDVPALPEQPAEQPPDPSWLIDLRGQVPGSTLLEFAEDVHRRLRNLGG